MTTKATTYTELAQYGEGALVYYLEIHGLGVFGTIDDTPGDSWYTSNGYSAFTRFYPWLQHVDLGPIDEQINFLEADLKVSKITAHITDVGGGFTALFKGWRSWNHSWLSSTVTSTASTIPVDASFSTTPQIIYLGQEAMAYTGTTSTSFTGVTRGYFHTQKNEHETHIDWSPPIQPVVSAGPHTIVGRRATLYAAVVNPSTGVVGATEVVYRGRVAKGAKAGDGEWTIPIEHIWETMKAKAGDMMPVTGIIPEQYYYSGDESITVGGSNFSVVSRGATEDIKIITVREGHYNPTTLLDEIRYQIGQAYTATELHSVVSFADLSGGRAILRWVSDTNYVPFVNVRRGDPLWALGFDVGTFEGEEGGQELEQIASNPPRPMVFEINPYTTTDPEIAVTKAEEFTSGLFVQVPGNAAVEVSAVNTDSRQSLTIDNRSMDRYRVDTSEAYLIVEDPANLIIRHVFTLGLYRPNNISNASLRDALEILINTYTSQAEPESWCPYGFEDDDFDWDELDEALGSVPYKLNSFVDVLTEGVEVWKLIGPAFAALGICPRLTSQGKIGFTRITNPPIANLETSILELDESMWSIIESAEVESNLDDSPLLNVTKFQVSHDYIGEDEWPATPEKIVWQEGLETMFQTRPISYQIRGWLVGDLNPWWTSREEWITTIRYEVANTHFGIWGRESATVSIPCTWTSRQLKCGDYCKITHATAPDTVEGSIGLSDRIGLVIRKRNLMAGSGADTILVKLGPDVNAGAIAPCALGTSYVASTAVMTFSTASTPIYEQSSANDLDRFIQSTGTVQVLLVGYDSTTALSYAGTIVTDGVSLTSGTVEFTSDPFSTPGFPTNGVYMIFPDWDNAASFQQDYAYSADATPTLGVGDDDPQEWTI